MAVETYALKGGTEGRNRLKVLSRVLRLQTVALFKRIGIHEGAACLDMGCGSGDVTFELAAIVGANGRVVGTDLDDEKLALAKAETEDRGIANVEFVRADAMAAASSEGSFDFVFARQLLCHVADPAHVLEQMIAFAATGAVVAAEDIDFSGYFSCPPCPELTAYMDYVRRTMSARGGDADIGQKLPGLLMAAGLQGVEVSVAQPAATEGEVKLIQPLTMEIVTESVIADGLAEKSEIQRITDALYNFAQDPKTLMSVPRFIQSWGRKSPTQASGTE